MTPKPMKRGKPLKRGKPMKRGKPLGRGKPIARKAALKAAPKKAASYQSTGPDRGTVEAVLERAGWCCEFCNVALGDRRVDDYQIQHRRPRANGGSRRPDTNSPANLMALCPPCHAFAESERELALHLGLLVLQTIDPATVAVLVTRERAFYLTGLGFGRGRLYLTAFARYSRTPPEKDQPCLT